jgi:hypothetical protein
MPDSIEMIEQPVAVVSSDEDQIIALLNGEPEKVEPVTEGVGVPEKEQDATKPATEPEKAVDTLDYGLKVPITGGEPVTLGELKDAYQSKQAAMLELTERENGVLRKMDEATLLMSYVQDLPPHVAEAAKAQAVQDYQREMQTLVNILPEVKTPEGAQAMKSALYELAAEYGLKKHDVDQVKNAVTLKMMYDYARLKASVRQAKEAVKPLRSASPTPGKANISSDATQLAIEKAKRSGSAGDKDAAIALLLRG